MKKEIEGFFIVCKIEGTNICKGLEDTFYLCDFKPSVYNYLVPVLTNVAENAANFPTFADLEEYLETIKTKTLQSKNIIWTYCNAFYNT